MTICERDHTSEMPDEALKTLEDLPRSQGGTWRHHCPACAYLSGFKAGEASALELLAGEYWKAGQAIVRELDVRSRRAAPGCSHDRIIVRSGDETFFPQRGCLDCSTWLDPVRLRRP
jgi:hypothetical protein